MKKTYEVALTENESLIITAKKVDLKSDGTLIFSNPRNSVSEQYVYGSEIIAAFQPRQYKYFHEADRS